MIPRLFAALAALFATTASADEEIIAALSQNRVSITANFDGSEIFVYGAVKRDAPSLEGKPLHAIVTVAGPMEPVLVRRKRNMFGIWVNLDAVEIDLAPSFYAVATSGGSLTDILAETEDLRHKISVERLIRSVGAPPSIMDSQEFTNALIRIRERIGLYSSAPVKIEFQEETLIGTHIALPANLLEGDYTVRLFLVRDGRIVDKEETGIFVRKVGLQRWIFALAHQQPLAYGALCVLLAVFAGWFASVAFRRRV